MSTCFVVQGFGKKTDFTDGRILDLDASYAVIKEAVQAAGLECIRADEIVHSGAIDLPMYEQLLRADLVVADLSTYNVNAIFELGVRYGLRPHATIIVAEEGFKHPFDVSHIAITPYKHLGEDIGRKEAERFKKVLADRIGVIVSGGNTDSPVYTFLHQLEPPRDRVLAALVSAVEAAVEVAVAAAPPPSDKDAGVGAQTSKWLLETALAKINAPYGQTSDFSGAKALLQMVLAVRPHDHFIVQQLALSTYKSKQPNPLDALLEARTLLLQLEPATSNDPETLGMWGAIHKRIWDIDPKPEHLATSITAYSRGFYLKQDYYNGGNLAVLLELRALLSARAGERDEAIADKVLARRVREEVLAYLTPQLAEKAELPPDKHYWVLASMWEANVGLGRDEQGTQWEQAARALKPPGWMLQSTEEQLVRVRNAQAELRVVMAAAGSG